MTSLALTFNDVTFNPVSQNDGQIWLTSSQIAEALEYKNTQSITKLFNTNSDEFDETMVKIVKLPTVNHAVTDSVTTLKTKGLSNKMRIFSLRGCHLLAMFARTVKAKEFRKWVLNILAKEVGQPVLTKVEKTEPKAKTTVADRVPLKDAVNVLVAKSSLNYSDAYKMVYQFMGVDSIDQIPLEDLPKAVAYVHSLTLISNNTTSLEIDEQKKKVSKLITAIWQLSAMTGATFLQTVILYDRGRLDYYKSYYRGVHRACADLVNAFDLKGHGNVPLLVGQTITTPSGVRFNIDNALI